ncbi:hypothetical protein [Ammoniphilus sp. YIM 78166]|uniref:hypothetical protein n=1 Tax=Ammoniphilus sp. YIM 78166 TaxID=1644106 RepID=UPI00106FC0E2|nr:hypothetical protein [Ammoniphilus sp. YIM 78166]
MTRQWIYSGYFYLIIITLLGILLRWKMIAPVWPELQFLHIVHAHSHVAFLGWVYFILNVVIVRHCFPVHSLTQRSMKIYYYLLHVSVVGMLITFSYQGYGVYSIAFSTLHAFLSYYFAYRFFSYRSQNWPWFASSFYQAAIWFNLLSSLGPWGVALNQMIGSGDSNLSNLFVYYYLHLQYNGWFTFVILGVCYSLAYPTATKPTSTIRWLFYMVAVSVIPSYLSTSLWFFDHPLAALIGMIGSLLQFLAIALFLIHVAKPLWLKQQDGAMRWLLGLSFISLGVKSLFELIGAWPVLSYAVFDSRQVIIAYLHLTLLGFITSFLLYYIVVVYTSQRLAMSSTVYCMGVAGMIILLFLAGLFEWVKISLTKSIWIGLLGTSLLIGGALLKMFWDIHKSYR